MNRFTRGLIYDTIFYTSLATLFLIFNSILNIAIKNPDLTQLETAQTDLLANLLYLGASLTLFTLLFAASFVYLKAKIWQ
ncbi:MAG: hypothetical protein ACQESG_01510, partial [Nanobdellota archaeon]